MCLSALLCTGQCKETEQQRREGRELASKSQSVNYLSIQFGRWLPKNAEGSSAHSSKGERGDNLLFRSPPDYHLCLTKCLLPIPGLWAMPGCTAYRLLITSQLSDSSLLSVLLSFHIACFHSILRILSTSSHLSLFLSARHSPLSPGSSVNPCLYQCSLCSSIYVLNLSVLFSSLMLYHGTHALPLFSIISPCFCLVLSLPLVLLFISLPHHSLN